MESQQAAQDTIRLRCVAGSRDFLVYSATATEEVTRLELVATSTGSSTRVLREQGGAERAQARPESTGEAGRNEDYSGYGDTGVLSILAEKWGEDVTKQTKRDSMVTLSRFVVVVSVLSTSCIARIYFLSHTKPKASPGGGSGGYAVLLTFGVRISPWAPARQRSQ